MSFSVSIRKITSVRDKRFNRGYTEGAEAKGEIKKEPPLCGDDVIPLVGVSRRSRLPKNLAILDITFSTDELEAFDRVFGPDRIIGNRYPAFVQKFAAQ